MVKLPTPPQNEAGAPPGRFLTLTFTDEVAMRFLMVVVPVSKKLSKMLRAELDEERTFTRQTSSAGSMTRVPVCCGTSTYLRSVAAL